MKKILRFPNFSKLYYAGLASELGSFVTETALMLLVFKVSSGDKSNLGTVRAVFLLFLTLGSLIGGPLGERSNRRLNLIYANIFRIPAIVLLYFYQDFYSILICNAIVAFFTGIYNPSRQAMINDIVPQKDIATANSLFGSTMAILHMVGPFIGATAFSAMGGIEEVLTFDLFTYIFGSFLLLKMAYRPPKKEVETKTHFFSDLKDGFSYIKKRTDITAIVINSVIEGFCIGVLIPLLLPFTTEVLGLGDQEYGILLSTFGLGGMVGGFLCHKLSTHFPSGKMIVITSVLEPLVMLLWLSLNNYYMNMIVFFIWGIVVFIRIPSQLNYISDTVETEYLSRVHSIMDLAFVIPNISGGLFVAFFANQYATLDLLKTTSYLFIFLIIPRILLKSMRRLYSSSEKHVIRDQSIQDSIS